MGRQYQYSGTSADANTENGTDLVQLDGTVTRAQTEEIDRVRRNAAIRAGRPGRDATDPVLTPDALEALAAGLADVQAGRTTPLADAKEELGLADGE